MILRRLFSRDYVFMNIISELKPRDLNRMVGL